MNKNTLVGQTGWDLEKWRTLLAWCEGLTSSDGPALDVDHGDDRVKSGSVQKRAVFDHADARRLVRRYRAGATLESLAREFGCSRSTIKSRLRANGAALRLVRPTDEEIDEMVARYAEGASLAAVGAAVGFDATSVMKYLRLRGVTLRDAQGRERPAVA